VSPRRANAPARKAKARGSAKAARKAAAKAPRGEPAKAAGAPASASTATAGRCPWPGDDPLMIAYHDDEWGVPLKDPVALYEKLVIDGFQAGLSWRIILHKRESMRRAFHGFDPERMARYGARDRARLLADPGIIRNRLKVDAAIANAKAFLALREAGLDFGELLWGFVGGKPIRHRCRALGDIPAETDESRAMSKELKRRGFRFVGPTICYAFMQAVGMVNDHLVTCARHEALAREGSSC
jgi:DNA-3-methyladenine glycosylase I